MADRHFDLADLRFRTVGIFLAEAAALVFLLAMIAAAFGFAGLLLSDWVLP